MCNSPLNIFKKLFIALDELSSEGNKIFINNSTVLDKIYFVVFNKQNINNNNNPMLHWINCLNMLYIDMSLG